MIFNLLKNKVYDAFAAILVKINQVNPIDTGKIRDDLFVIRSGTANFYIYKTDCGVICFDCGFGKSQIKRELCSLGIDLNSITHLFLTHSDFDHANGLPLFENAKVFLSSDEEQMVNRKKARKFGFIYNFRIKREYHLLKDNDYVEVGLTKIRAIATPGHTPGSMCYLINETILIVGDAFRIVNGKVCPIKLYNMDSKMHRESIRKLACLDNIELVCTGHRGYYKKFSEAINHWK